MRVPLVIVTGYLGAGKTTLLRNLIDKTNKKVAVLMNEFGEIGVDNRIVKGKNVDMVELAGGCVCCSLTGELENALKEVVTRINPELIVLETTGVAEPDAIIDTVDADFGDVRLDSVITVVDADALVRSPAIGHTGRVQIEVADVLLLNKIDLVEDASALAHLENRVRALNDRAALYRTVRCDVDWALVLGLYEPKKNVRHRADDHIEVSSFVVQPERPLNRSKFEKFASEMPPAVYRAKGFVRLDGKTYLFSYVAGRYELEEWSREKQRLVFIGKNVQDQKDRIEKMLKGCA